MKTLLGQLPDGKYMYQCSCGETLTSKYRLNGPKLLSQCFQCSDRRVAGSTNHPLYFPWNNDYKKLWPSFESFLMEVSPWPGPRYMLTGRDGHHASPGNVRWVERPPILFPLHDDTMTDYRKQFYSDKDLKILHEEAYRDITVSPHSKTAFLAHLERLEREWTPNGEESLEDQQIKREKASQMFAIEKGRIQDEKAYAMDRSSQTRTGRSIRNKLVPVLAIRMEEHYRIAMSRGVGSNLDLIDRLAPYVDWKVMAHITVTCVMDLVGKGDNYRTELTKLHRVIGERLDHQAFYEHVCRTDPRAWDKIDRWYLQDDVMGYTSKLRNAQQVAGAHGYNFFSPKERVQIGNWAWGNLQSITDWFTVKPWWNSREKLTHYLALSDTGLQYASIIVKLQEDHSFDTWPMLVPPLPWEEGKRGGYLKFHPSTSYLVRNARGTVENTQPSQEAIAALNKMQSVPFKLNTWIYGIQKALTVRTNEIGNFRSFEADSFKDIYYPLIDPAVWDLPRVNDNIHPDIKAAKRKLKAFHKQSKVAFKERVPTERLLRVAARFVHVPRFYLPCYMDTRTRKYYMVDTLNPQGGDNQKALLLFADGVAVTDANREIVREDLLYTLANNWAGKVEGTHIKSDKLPVKERVEFGRTLANQYAKLLATDPTSSDAMKIWTAAEEPFQFLATIKEYYDIFEAHHKKTVAEVPCGRDASNSGMQIQGGFLRDEKMCLFTNVVKTPAPMDAYEEVATEVRKVIQDRGWVEEQLERRRKSAERNEKERQELDSNYEIKNKDFTFNVKPSDITRSVLKRSVMTTLYGASWQSKFEYISDELNAIGKFSLTDRVITTNAQVKGQAEAFPRSKEIDDWFRSIGKAVLNRGGFYVKWKTAAGSWCIQEYREPITELVSTYGMGGAPYYQVMQDVDGTDDPNTHRHRVQTGWGEVKEHKTQTAFAANWTHSQDASIIQKAFKDADYPFYAVHDCGYAPAGAVSKMVGDLKQAYLDVVESDVLDGLPSYNQVEEEVMVPDKGNVFIRGCLDSQYMFA